MEKLTSDELLTKDLKGKIVCFPTDTVYGVGALYNDLDGIHKIYDMKKRDASKPLAILTPNTNIENFVLNITQDALQYMKEWPGALTIIFKRSDVIDPSIVNGKDTVAFRMPDSDIALKILNHFGCMATTSVNISGEKEMNSINEIAEMFGDFIDYIVVDETTFSGKPSMIVDCSTNETKIIRR